MTGIWLVPVIFAALALLFGWLAWRDKRGEAASASPAVKTRTRIAVIFALVSLILFLLQARN